MDNDYEQLDRHEHYGQQQRDFDFRRSASPQPWSLAQESSTPNDGKSRSESRRRSNTPSALFGAASGSLFGSGSPPMRPPLVTVQNPSNESAERGEGPRPLSTLAQASSSSAARRRQQARYEDEIRATVDRRRIPRVEKDVDDPTTPLDARQGTSRQESTTLMTLNRLFAVQAPVSPISSRAPSYTNSVARSPYARQLPAETAPLPDHLYARGLLEGRHSDITVHAFGHAYKLHRLILDRAPFFTSALSEPWLEANAREITVRPEEIDASITQSSFELALKRLYGCSTIGEEDADSIGLFATGCWLEMQDLTDSSIESMLRQMTPETLSPLIKLVTGNYYGRAGDKILASAKAMLCRDGWRMPLKYWDGIPGDIIREIVGGDGFFIDGEWDRWVLAKRILDRRLKARAVDTGLLESGKRRKVLKAPDTANLMAVRFDTVYRKNSAGHGRGVPDALHRWITLYTYPDVEPVLVLLDEGIHYVHLDFEQLQFIRDARDVLGLPVMPEKVISNALWQQMELRQKVMNARDPDMKLGLSVTAEDGSTINDAQTSRDTTMSIATPSTPPIMAKQKTIGPSLMTDGLDEEPDEGLDSGSWDGNGKPRKFWIPSSDCNIVMGGGADPVIATSNNAALQRHANRLSATIQPEDIQWAADFAAVTSEQRILSNPPPPRPGSANGSMPEMMPVAYTHFPPFRFAAEFPNPRLLKEKKRVYSRTVFYAGSLWNIYIQKVASTKSKQLGVYLHRAKERETEEVIAGTAGLAQGSVDERIGLLEREMILRSERHERRPRRPTRLGNSEEAAADGGESSGSTGDPDASLNAAIDGAGPSASSARASTMRNLLSRGRRKSSQNDLHLTSPTTGGDDSMPHLHEAYSSSASSSDSDEAADPTLEHARRRFHIPALPPYVDARPTIKTYFKIYSPSRGGRMLSVYESAPDRFNFSQSWGWKSSTLMLDEGLLGEEGPEEEAVSGDSAAPAPANAASSSAASAAAKAGKERRDGKLRFMVVIGNI